MPSLRRYHRRTGQDIVAKHDIVILRNKEKEVGTILPARGQVTRRQPRHRFCIARVVDLAELVADRAPGPTLAVQRKTSRTQSDSRKQIGSAERRDAGDNAAATFGIEPDVGSPGRWSSAIVLGEVDQVGDCAFLARRADTGQVPCLPESPPPRTCTKAIEPPRASHAGPHSSRYGSGSHKPSTP